MSDLGPNSCSSSVPHPSSLSACRLILDPPAPGAWNMAVDEVLWEWAGATGECCWRFYRWEEPTLSLGYSQSYEERERHPPSRRCSAVRRISGGGAILHDHELTYSLVVPANHHLARRSCCLCTKIHNSLVGALAEAGIVAGLCREPIPRPKSQPFLCFERRSLGDVVVQGVKVAGSAQRRSRGAVLQHGSVLLARSPAAPELAGLVDVAGIAVRDEDLARIWLEKLAESLGLVWRHTPLSDGERAQAARLAESKFASARWTLHRGRRGHPELF